jgi:hypothetical protein
MSKSCAAATTSAAFRYKPSIFPKRWTANGTAAQHQGGLSRQRVRSGHRASISKACAVSISSQASATRPFSKRIT